MWSISSTSSSPSRSSSILSLLAFLLYSSSTLRVAAELATLADRLGSLGGRRRSTWSLRDGEAAEAMGAGAGSGWARHSSPPPT